MKKQRTTTSPLVSQREYGRLRNISSAWVSRLVREGKIPSVGGRIDVVKADQALADQAAEKGDAITLAESTRRWRLACARLRELELQTRKGQVIELGEVMHAQMQVNSNIRSRLLQLGSKLAQRLTGHEGMAKIKTLVDAEVYETLTELSQTAGNVSLEVKFCSKCERKLQGLAQKHMEQVALPD